MKNYCQIAFILLLLLCLPLTAASVKYPAPVGHVNDFAGIMSPGAVENLERILGDFRAKTGNEIAIVTVGDMGGSDEKTYAVELMKEWGVGSKELNNGILILIAVKERLLRIEVGYGLEGVVTDARSGQVRDRYMVPFLEENRWDEGITQGTLAICALIAEDSGKKLDEIITGEVHVQAPVSRRTLPFVNIVIFIILALFLAKRGGRSFLFGMLPGSALRSGRHSHYGGYSNFGGGFSGGGGGFSGFGGGFSGGGGASGRF